MSKKSITISSILLAILLIVIGIGIGIGISGINSKLAVLDGVNLVGVVTKGAGELTKVPLGRHQVLPPVALTTVANLGVKQLNAVTLNSERLTSDTLRTGVHGQQLEVLTMGHDPLALGDLQKLGGLPVERVKNLNRGLTGLVGQLSALQLNPVQLPDMLQVGLLA
ncbi:MAG: hypothetical protein V7641_2424 [Blastocatellia bacterium]